MGRHVKTHPTFEAGVMSIENGKHTGELLSSPQGPLPVMEPRIDDPEHPAVKWVPRDWALTTRVW